MVSTVRVGVCRQPDKVGGAEHNVEHGHDRTVFDDLSSAGGALGQVTFDHHHLRWYAGTEREDSEELGVLATGWDDMVWFQEPIRIGAKLCTQRKSVM